MARTLIPYPFKEEKHLLTGHTPSHYCLSNCGVSHYVYGNCSEIRHQNPFTSYKGIVDILCLRGGVFVACAFRTNPTHFTTQYLPIIEETGVVSMNITRLTHRLRLTPPPPPPLFQQPFPLSIFNFHFQKLGKEDQDQTAC